MSAPTLRILVERYLVERRRLGFDLRKSAYALRSFARYVGAVGHRGPLTVEVMADWARRDSHGSTDPRTWARRLKLLRSFMRWLRQFEPRTEVPDDAIFGPLPERQAPHIYSEQEFVDLLAAARRLGPSRGLRGIVFETLFGLIGCCGQEMLAVLGQPGSGWTSQRDHLLLAMLYNTGARVSEIIGVRVVDVVLEGAPCVHLHGKGRKERSVPLWKTTQQEIRAWLRINPRLRGEAALLPNRDGLVMTRCNVAQRLDLAVSLAATRLPSLANKQISPHTLRHTTAMHLLQSGVPFNVIALWLGHESTNTTHRYVEADLAMKETALARLEPPDTKLRRFRASDSLLRFLQTL